MSKFKKLPRIIANGTVYRTVLSTKCTECKMCELGKDINAPCACERISNHLKVSVGRVTFKRDTKTPKDEVTFNADKQQFINNEMDT